MPKVNETLQALGEVISSSITGLVAESWQEDDEDGLPTFARPNFGSFLKVDSVDEGLNVIAVVYNVITGPQDTNHKPQALGMSREQLRLEQPHIFALLRTEIHAITVGYSIAGEYFQQLPPRPPQVHDFVFAASDDEVRKITDDLDFLRLVCQVSAVPSDELVAAAIRSAYRARQSDYNFLVSAGQALSHLFRDDYDRLLAILRKIKPP